MKLISDMDNVEIYKLAKSKNNSLFFLVIIFTSLSLGASYFLFSFCLVSNFYEKIKLSRSNDGHLI
jgi:hypothetical protein